MVYPIGIPMFFGVLLRNNRDRLQEPFIRAQLGFLYAGYRKQAWWFELVDLIHKLIVTSLLAFLTTEGQLTTAIVVIVIYLIIILRVHPYQRKEDDALHMYSQVELFLFVLAGYVFYKLDQAQYSARDDIIISISLIGVTIGFLALFVYQALYAAYRQINKMINRYNRNKLKKQKKAAAAGGGAGSAGSAAGGDAAADEHKSAPGTAHQKKPSQPFALEMAGRPITASNKPGTANKQNDNSMSEASESDSSDTARGDKKTAPPQSAKPPATAASAAPSNAASPPGAVPPKSAGANDREPSVSRSESASVSQSVAGDDTKS